MNKKIALVIDCKNWIFDTIAKELKKNLTDYEIDIISADVFDGNIVKMVLLSSKYDLMHFFWRGHISWLESGFSKDYIHDLGYEYNEFITEYLKNGNITTTVCDHLFLNSEEYRTKFIFKNIKNYIVSSKTLYDIYNTLPEINKPMMEITDGVDLNMFSMESKKKYDNINRKIIIGWCGNSKFSDEKDEDLKGLNKIINPAIRELQEEGMNIKLEIADRNIKLIPHEQMPRYYNSIDIYVCASRTEGTPAPILEAMACGIPIISTNVGIVTEVFGKKQKEFIIKRDKTDMKEKIKKMLENKNIMKELSQENLEGIKEKDWKCQAIQMKEFFDNCIKKG